MFPDLDTNWDEDCKTVVYLPNSQEFWVKPFQQEYIKMSLLTGIKFCTSLCDNIVYVQY